MTQHNLIIVTLLSYLRKITLNYFMLLLDSGQDFVYLSVKKTTLNV